MVLALDCHLVGEAGYSMYFTLIRVVADLRNVSATLPILNCLIEFLDDELSDFFSYFLRPTRKTLITETLNHPTQVLDSG
jgi:hypothetical protein